ncbi:MAG: tRNA1(Val) (adenine(37)-N6)-methyltransferase [Bacillota bacterium]|nr:tRNA1(Val) (adenine(37)-N6)-methyltransferase [Bacillota bacterium]
MTGRELLRESETLDDLILGGLHIIQSKQGYRFSLDAVLLSQFAQPEGVKTIIDIGTGNGVIPLLMSYRTAEARILGVEIQKTMAERARRSTVLNQKEKQIEILNEDICQIERVLPGGYAQLVLSNPPFWRQGEGKISQNEEAAIARHELHLNMKELVEKAFYLLQDGGKFAVIQRAERMEEMMKTFVDRGFRLKRMRLIHSLASRNAKLVLLEGQKHGRGQLDILPPLIIYEKQGEYCEELRRIYAI